jgi:DNA-binding MarR family transcriptional regulator
MCYYSDMNSKHTNNPQELQNENLLNLDLQMCFALYSASLSMTKVYRPLLAKLKITYPQYLVMMVLWQNDGQTVNALCEKLFSDSGTLTPLLKRLEKQGFIQRQRSQEDERKVVVTLTKAGADLKKEASAVPMQIICTTGCNLDQLQDLTERLKMLRSSLIKHCKAV